MAALLLAACGSPQSTSPATTTTSPAVAATAAQPPDGGATTADARFDDLAARFLSKYLELAPVEATTLGNHTHDATWPDPSEAGDTAWLSFIADTRAALAAIPADGLGEQRRIDASILANELDRIEFGLRELKRHVRSPVYYTGVVGEGLDA